MLSLTILMMVMALQGMPDKNAGLPPGVHFRETIFEVKDGKISAPRAKHVPENRGGPEALKYGWTPADDGDYIAYDAGEILNKEQGTITINMLVIGDGRKVLLAPDRVDALVTFYDDDDRAFFSIGLNDHDLVVGSFPMHPMLMENAFGGVGFPYLSKLGGRLKEGDEITISVTWGPRPSDDRVYFNGRYMDMDSRRGPKSGGKTPGYPQTATFSSFLGGFGDVSGGRVGPLKVLAIGKMDSDKSQNKMYPPRSVAIRSVITSSGIEPP